MEFIKEISKSDLPKYRMHDGSPVTEACFDAYIRREYMYALRKYCRKLVRFVDGNASEYEKDFIEADNLEGVEQCIVGFEGLYEKLIKEKSIVAKLDDYQHCGRIRQSRVKAKICQAILNSRDDLRYLKSRDTLNEIEFADMIDDPERGLSPEERLLRAIFCEQDMIGDVMDHPLNFDDMPTSSSSS